MSDSETKIERNLGVKIVAFMIWPVFMILAVFAHHYLTDSTVGNWGL